MGVSQNPDQHTRYLCIDTCCIDKTSQPELSEVVRSKFSEYKEASICYVSLADEAVEHLRTDPRAIIDADAGPKRWFTRGGTLQELLAPENMLFHNASWDFIGTREFWRTRSTPLPA